MGYQTKWSISFSEDQGILRLHKVHTTFENHWGLGGLLSTVVTQQSMETCSTVLLLGTRQSAKYSIALTASRYFDTVCYISNEVVSCSEVFVSSVCQICYLGSWSWKEPGCSGSWIWYSPFLKGLIYPADFGIFTLIYGNSMELSCNRSVPPWLRL